MNVKDFVNTGTFLSYYEMTLTLDSRQHHRRKVNHLQITELPFEFAQDGITHAVRFYDGEYHRELLGLAFLDREDGVGEKTTLILDMGQGKTYRFKKQGL
jgi:hypothetical protein